MSEALLNPRSRPSSSVPAVMSLIDQFLRPSYLLWGGLAINLDPSETRQVYHCDDKAHSRDARLWPHGV
jgi:hypothetical protein